MVYNEEQNSDTKPNDADAVMFLGQMKPSREI